MAITTGAADTGVLNLDLGSRPRAAAPGDRAGFASALDTQMQKPRSESPAPSRAKDNPSAQPPAEKGKNDGDTTTGKGRTADAKPVEKGKEKDEKKASNDSAQSLVALILQTGKEGEAEGTDTTVPTGTAGESGKDLPQEAANDPAAALLASGGNVTADGKPETDKGAATTLTRTVDPRFTAVQGTDAAVAKANDDADRALVPQPGDGDSKNTTKLLQTAAQPEVASAPAAGSEKGDPFAATLAALRDATPRGNSDANAPVNVSATAAPNVTPQTNATPANTAPNTSTVNVPVGQSGWDQAMGERVLWMTRHGLQEAKIELNPRDLGPIEIKVSVQQDQANVAFTAHTPAAREALEAAMPRLREMMAESGLNLAQSDVSHRSPQQQSESGWGNGNQRASGNLLENGMEEQPAAVMTTPLSELGAVDFYA